jgi:hypothetical protein
VNEQHGELLAGRARTAGAERWLEWPLYESTVCDFVELLDVIDDRGSLELGGKCDSVQGGAAAAV